MTNSLKLMCITAHPDDESLGLGGVIAKYASEGIDTYLVTATRGERGWQDKSKPDPGLQVLGKLREAELQAATAVLGIKELTFLDYIDGDLDRADHNKAVGKIVAELRRVRPQVVLTFGPDGAYGHPDHIAICQFATAAVMCAADGSYQPDGSLPPHRVSKLYYMAETQYTANQYIELFGNIVMPVDGVDRSVVVWPDWVISARIDTSDCWSTVMKAILCHRTQYASLGEVERLPEESQKALRNPTTFYRAFSIVNGGRTVETDLFEGLR